MHPKHLSPELRAEWEATMQRINLRFKKNKDPVAWTRAIRKAQDAFVAKHS